MYLNKNRVVDPDPNWIRIQQLCGSGYGSVFRILIQMYRYSFKNKIRRKRPY